MMPKVYGVELPPIYYQWMQFFEWVNLDWAGLIIPGDCLTHGFHERLLVLKLHSWILFGT